MALRRTTDETIAVYLLENIESAFQQGRLDVACRPQQPSVLRLFALYAMWLRRKCEARGEGVSLEEAIPQHMQDYYRYVMKGLLARDSRACAKLFAEVIAETQKFYGHLVPTSFA